MNNIEILKELVKTPLGMFEAFIFFIIVICMFLVFMAIIIDFMEFHQRKNAKKTKKNIVETGTMFLFFLIYSSAIRFNIGRLDLNNLVLRIVLIIIGTSVIVLGCYVNISGRIKLGKNWSNQIKIYKDQSLVTTGIYSYVRHPLYASLIWMFYGGAIVYLNYVAFLLNTFVFLPFMYYRAREEEKLLSEEFKNYKEYKLKTGMFFPRLKKR